ncbi:MAG: serine/threonine-protein kinase [Polyangiales bacterium]
MSSRHDAQIRSRARRFLGALIDGKYRLLELLGYGSAGAVYRAENEWAGRSCALKLFHYQGPDEDALLRRFMREARAANRVRRDGRPHPNVADALDVGRDLESGRLFIVQELLQGVTLAQRIAQAPGRRLGLDEAVGVILPILDAIGAAHAAGIVHRDLKPENIFLAEEGGETVPKLLDFGIAKLIDERMTPIAEVMGTPQYMAPESFRGAGEADATGRTSGPRGDPSARRSGRAPFASPTDTRSTRCGGS